MDRAAPRAATRLGRRRIADSFIAGALAALALPAGAGAAPPGGGASPPASAPKNVLTCGTTGPDLTTTSSSPVAAAGCTIDAPVDGTIVLVASGGAVLSDTAYEARYQLALDAIYATSTDHWVNVDTGGDGSIERPMFSTQTYDVTAGSHTVTLGVSRYSGTGTVAVEKPRVAAIFLPSTGTPYRVCQSGNTTAFNTSTSGFTNTASCSIDVPAAAHALVLGDASAGLATAGAAYEGRAELGFDGTYDSGTDRWWNVYTDAGDGTDISVSDLAVRPVGAGTHTFSLGVSLYSGAGPVQLYRPRVIALTVPDTAAQLLLCGATANTTASLTSTTFASGGSCSLTAPSAGTAFVAGGGSWGLLDPTKPNEGGEALRLDGAVLDSAERRAEIVNDSLDGTDVPAGDAAVAPISAGSHSFDVGVRLSAGSNPLNVYDPSIAALFVPAPDTTAPGTSITTSPPDLSASSGASIAFTSPDGDVAGFSCSLDGAAFTTCVSPLDLTGLADGSHTVRVSAFDAVDNVDQSPASTTWTVDATPPPVQITGAPAGTVASTSATVSFSSSEAGATFRCSLDGAAFTTCSSPLALTGLADGSHTVRVEAADALGNTSAPAAATWTVDTTPPPVVITGAPTGTVASASATITFSSSEAGATFRCSLDGADFAGCSSPLDLTGLADGSHTVRVEAADALGNTSAPAAATWTVDTTPPVPPDPVVLLRNLALAPRVLRPHHPVVARFTLSRPAPVTLEVRKIRVRGGSQLPAVRVITGDYGAGAHAVSIPRTIRGWRLAPGCWALVVRAALTPAQSLTFAVARRSGAVPRCG